MPPDLTSLIFAWFEHAVPKPNQKNLHTQIGCHFEEVAEMIYTLKGKDRLTQSLLTQGLVALYALADHLKSNGDCIELLNPAEFLDSLCDQTVTATGVGYMMKADFIGALADVNASNWSKFVHGRPVFDANMKIQKGPNYFKANSAVFLPSEPVPVG